MKNTSLSSKNTTLFPILESHFDGNLNKARIKFISLFIEALCRVKSVNYDKVACGFNSNASKESCYRRIQRFMRQFNTPMETISKLIFCLLPCKTDLCLALDRTNWKFGEKNINILMLGVCYKNVCFPLMFKMLDKRGNSNSDERIELMQNYIDWFGVETIDSLMADREFVGEKWIEFLNLKKIRYDIRIRNNFKVFLIQKQEEINVSWLFNSLKMNEFYHYPKIVKINGQLCYISGCKTRDREGVLEYLILISFNKPEYSIENYKKRWQIETLFRGLKSSGFNIEDTHVTIQDRLERLILLIMIAFTWCYKIGDYIDENFKKIKIKKHGRRAISVFKYGLTYLSKYLNSGHNRLEINLFQFLSCT